MPEDSDILNHTPARRRWEGVIVAAAAIVLALHVRTYWFLTDDAFISFRYARNWAEGFGLVFNPGGEPVEGYSNFLWVVLLAAGVKLGVAAERLAPWLGVFSTAALWLAVARYGRRLLPHRARHWAWVAPLALATNRSFAVWATSGLETRLFELLTLAGLALLWCDTRTLCAHRGPRRRRAGLVLALATLVRPDTLILVVGAACGAEWLLWRARRGQWRDSMRAWSGVAVAVATHTAFRFAYYGLPLPNTFYAKFGGAFAGDWGVMYVAWFAVEYALLLWVPLWIAGVRAWRERAPGLGLVLMAAFVPYVLYVIYAGGDHFEFRMLDILWVPLALLLQSGVAHLAGAGSGMRRQAAAAAAAVALLGLAALLPTLSHQESPSGYVKGFPGENGRGPDDHDLVRAARLPVVVQPVLRLWIATSNAFARRLTVHFVGLRQEEHRAFRDRVTNVALDVKDLVTAGLVPADTRIALHCVGIIPYITRLWTLDRLGLCDAHVAHSAWVPGPRRLAHSKLADAAYVASRGVEIEPVLPFSFFTADEVVRWTRTSGDCRPEAPCFVARMGPDLNLLVKLPAGIANARTRFPRLPFEPLTE